MPLKSTDESVFNTDIFSDTKGEISLVETDGSLAVPDLPRPSARQVRWQDYASDQFGQVRRTHRLRLICLFAEIYLLILTLLHTQDKVGSANLIGIVVIVVVLLLGLYGVFALRLNQKAKEKNLILPISLMSLTVMLGTFYVEPATSSVFTPFAFIVAAYGMYHLTQKTMMFISAITLISYAIVIGLHHIQNSNVVDYGSALMSWVVLALTLPGFVFLTARVQRLHSALYQAGLKIRSIEEHARRDQFLGCYNRRYLVCALEEQKRRADKSKEPLCLIVMDLDHFKKINDEVGHLAGDEVLRTFSRIAQENVRQGDIFGRYGGEEFVLILPETPLLAALNTAERIREQVEAHCWQGKVRHTVTVSAGLTQYIPGESVLDLFSRTDTAMYLAKRGGRNQVVVEEPNKELWQFAEGG